MNKHQELREAIQYLVMDYTDDYGSSEKIADQILETVVKAMPKNRVITNAYEQEDASEEYQGYKKALDEVAEILGVKTK